METLMEMTVAGLSGIFHAPMLLQSPVERLARHIRGSVIQPFDTSYESERRVWNAAIDRRPAVIVRPSGPSDIQIAVRFAASQGLPLSIRSGGHAVAGSAVADGGVMIDMRSLKGLRIDPSRRIAHAETGLTWGEFNAESRHDGLTVPSGKLGGIGIGGSALGGGLGWLIRQHGMSIDHIRAAQMVTADGQLLNVNADEHPDLFWAIRGGGGNFGVVTSLTFSMVPVSMIYGGMVLFPVAFAGQVFRAFREVITTAPETLVLSAALLSGPDGSKLVAVGACFNGPVKEGERLLRPIVNAAPAVMVGLREIPYNGLLSAMDASAPGGMGHCLRGGFADALSDELIDRLVTGYAAAPSPHTTLIVNHVGGGAMNRVASDATPFPHRDARLLLEVIGSWGEGSGAIPTTEWTIDFWESLQPFTTGGVPVGMLSNEGPERVRAAYGHNYDRLATIKRWYDPDNLFHHNQNISPH
jgi:hypothetical protein